MITPWLDEAVEQANAARTAIGPMGVVVLRPEKLLALAEVVEAADDLSHEAAWQGHESPTTERLERALARLDEVGRE